MTRAVQRWTPWLLGAAAAGVYVAFAPRGGADEGAVWRAVVGAVGEARGAAAVVLGAATVIAAWLAIRVGGGEVAAIAGAVAAAAVLVGAGPWAHAAAPGTFVLGAALVLGAIALADRVAAGGGKAPGVACGALLGAAVAVDHTALAVAAVVLALVVVRLWHGARWTLAVVPAGAIAWLVAMIPAWRAASAATGARISDARYALELADGVGAIAAVAAAAGVITVIARRSTRWAGVLIAAAVIGGIAIDRAAGHGIGAAPIVGLALAAGAGVARLARLVALPAGQACLGAAAAVVVALPAVLAI